MCVCVCVCVFCFFGTERKQNAFTVSCKGEIDIVPYSASFELAEKRMLLSSAVKGTFILFHILLLWN